MSRILLGLWVVLFLIGCAAPGPFDDWVERDPANWPITDKGAQHADATLLTQLPTAQTPIVAPDATVEDFVQLALKRNPALRSAKHKIARLLERVPQVTSLDDPMFTVSPIGEMAETAEGMVGLMSSVSQKLPFPGKLDAKGRIALQEAAMAAQELNETRLRIIADVRRAYWSHYFTTRAVEVIERDRLLLRKFKQDVDARVRVGSAPSSDALRASVELSDLENKLLTTQQRQTTARAMLNQLLNRPVNANLPTPAVLEPESIELDLDALLADAARKNPQLAKIHERIQLHRERLTLARLERWPDLTVGLTYNAVDDEGRSITATGQDQWWLTFGVNLPIWLEKRGAAEREARQGVFEGLADLTDQQNRIAFRIQDALVRVETQQRLVILFRDVIIPQAKQTVDASAGAYQAGKVDFPALVDNWRKLLHFELMHHQSVAQLEQDFADLQREAGADLLRSAPEASLEESKSTDPPKVNDHE